jgi:hypothetical protein
MFVPIIIEHYQKRRDLPLYEYLEGLIKKGPQTHEKGPSMSSKTKNEINTASPQKAQYRPRKRLPGPYGKDWPPFNT